MAPAAPQVCMMASRPNVFGEGCVSESGVQLLLPLVYASSTPFILFGASTNIASATTIITDAAGL